MHFITHVGLCLYVSNFICIVNKSYTSTKTSICLDNTFILCRRLQNRKYMLAQRTKSQQDCFKEVGTNFKKKYQALNFLPDDRYTFWDEKKPKN